MNINSNMHIFLIKHNQSLAQYLFLTDEEDEDHVLEKIDGALITAKKLIDDNGINYANPKIFFETNGTAKELKPNSDFKIVESNDFKAKIKYQKKEIVLSKNQPYPL